MKTISLILLSIIFFTACGPVGTVPNCGDNMISVPTWYCTNAGSRNGTIVTDVKYICSGGNEGSSCNPPADILFGNCVYTDGGKSPHKLVLKCISNIIVDTTPGTDPNNPDIPGLPR